MDRISGFVVFSLGIGILWQGRHLAIGSFRAPGPGFFPTLIAVTLIILSLFLIIPGGKRNKGQSFSIRSTGRVLTVFVPLLFYFFFLEYLGFVITSFLLLTVLFVGFASQRWHIAVLEAFLFTGMAYVLFEMLLKSHLPKGVLGF